MEFHIDDIVDTPQGIGKISSIDYISGSDGAYFIYVHIEDEVDEVICFNATGNEIIRY